MKIKEMMNKVNEIVKRNDENYDYTILGIRFENKIREEGEIVKEYSKSNYDRDDERDFPDYGTEEYSELPDLDGISTYSITSGDYTGWTPVIGWDAEQLEKDVENWFMQNHCYILGSDRGFSGEDENEVIMQDAKVVAVIF